MHAFSHKLSQVTYPRMERQDLTQGQLGSFKFTPTDDVRSSYYRASPVLTQPYPRDYPSNLSANLPSEFTTTMPSNVECSAYNSRTSDVSPTRFDSTFFDSYIKPDLDKSRLRLGPTALRAAVDGAPTSPHKQFSGIKGLRNGYQSTNMDSNQISPYDSRDSNGAFGAIPTFVPRVSGTAQDNDANLLHTSLIRALASEQQAHQETRNLLEIERNGRIKAEEEAQKYSEHNRSLIGSVNMLKSVVQHSVKKEQQAAQQAEVLRYYQAVEQASPPQTILHDAVKNLRTPIIAESETEKPVDTKLLFDFDLVEKHGTPALRRQFSTLMSGYIEKTSVEDGTDDQPVTNASESQTERQSPDKNENSAVITNSENTGETDTDDETVVLKSVSENIPKVKPENDGKMMVMPFDPLVSWKQKPIFDSHTDKFNRIGHSRSIFAEHPVRYFPDLSDKNIYRTLMIDFLPLGSTYTEVLDNVRGGGIESIQMHGPIGRSTRFMTARVVFHYERSANSVYLRGQNPGIYVKGKRARVWQVLEATYPRGEKIEAQIFEEGYTRILIIEGAMETSLAKLPKKLARQMKAGFVIKIGKTYDDIPMVEFTSVAQCVKALEQLMNDPEFGGCKFDFDDDPCNDPYPEV